MTVPKPLSRTKTHVRSKSLTVIGVRQYPVSAKANWTEDAERICWFDLETLTLTLLHCSKNRVFFDHD